MKIFNPEGKIRKFIPAHIHSVSDIELFTKAVQDIITDAGGGGVISWTEVTGTSQTIEINKGYIANNIAEVEFILPNTANVGDIVRIVGKGIGKWKITQIGSNQVIHNGSLDSSVGVGEGWQATNRRDAMDLLCTVKNDEWTVINSIGLLTKIGFFNLDFSLSKNSMYIALLT